MLAYVYWFLSATTLDAREGQLLVSNAASSALEIDASLPIANSLHVASNSNPYSVLAEIEALEQGSAIQIDNPWMLDIPVWQATFFNRLGFTAYPGYLEIAEMLGYVDMWEECGPPDFCQQTFTGWTCE